MILKGVLHIVHLSLAKLKFFKLISQRNGIFFNSLKRFIDLLISILIHFSDALKAYIVNGLKKGKNTPKLSLMVSAHLMKGLVIILHKKNTYLYGIYLKFQPT